MDSLWRVVGAETRFNNELRYRDAAHPDNVQFTPGYVLQRVRFDLDGIDLDPCTADHNPVNADRFYTERDNGLAQRWNDQGLSGSWYPSIFVNPPYGRAREPWVKKCIATAYTGQRIILLIPAATDTRIFQEAASTADAIVFVKGRLKFSTLRPNRRRAAASHPSALIGWNTDLRACSTLGWKCHG